MHKKILNAEQSKEVAYKAIGTIAGIVKATLGPGGNPIILERQGQHPDGTPLTPLITKDGVTVASHLSLRDPALNTIVKTILQVAQNTVKEGGDGTTTSIVLAEAIYNAGYKYLQQGTNNIQLYNELNAVKDELVAAIDKIKTPIDESGAIDVATISANGDREIAQIVSDAIKAVGEEGYTALEDGYTRETTLEIIEGAVYKTAGWKSFGPLGYNLVTNRATNSAEIESPAMLTYAGKLQDTDELIEFLNKIMGQDPATGAVNPIPFLILAYDYSDEVKNWIIKAKLQGMKIAAVKAPYDGSPNARTEMLEDIAALVGGKVGAKGILPLENIEDEHLGCADKVEITPEELVIYGGQGDKKIIMKRIEDLNTLIDSGSLSQWDADNVRLRKGKLSNGIAIIRAGGTSELEMSERKDRIEDALCAAKVALKDGVVPGGGLTLSLLAEALPDAGLAYKIMKEALQEPMNQIIRNVGEDPAVIRNELKHLQVDGEKRLGYNAKSKTYEILQQNGVVDPAIVTKAALQNAVSIAGLLLTAGGALVSDADPEDGKANPMAAMMGLG